MLLTSHLESQLSCTQTLFADVGAIVSSLNQVGIESVGYHGEMDPRDRMESYMKWKSGEVQIIVATKAFGMGINKANIRHVIRNGVPESIVAWTQELGRAGPGDGNASNCHNCLPKS